MDGKDSSYDTETLKRDFTKLRASLDGMKDRLGSNAQEVLDRVASYLDSGKVSERLDGIEDELIRLGGRLGRLKESGRDAAHKLETEVTAKPLASVAIAFGIGLLASGMLRRR